MRNRLSVALMKNLSRVVINVALPYQDLTIMDAVLRQGSLLDTATTANR